jgi:hypothetical protein
MIGFDVPCQVALACVGLRTDWLAEIANETRFVEAACTAPLLAP